MSRTGTAAAGILLVLMFTARILLALFQIAAIVDGLRALFGLHWLLACVLWVFTTAIPFLPTILGFAGAIKAWHWEWWEAGLLFFGLQAIVVVIAGMSGVGLGVLGLLKWRRPRL